MVFLALGSAKTPLSSILSKIKYYNYRTAWSYDFKLWPYTHTRGSCRRKGSYIHGLVTFLCCIIIVVKEKQNSLDAIFVRPPKTHLMHFSSVHQKLLLRTITLKLRIIRMQNFQRLLLINYFHNLAEGIFFGNENFILSFA